MRSFKGLILVAVLFMAVPAAAQEPGDPDVEGCTDSKLLTRMPGCTIVECSAREFDAVSLQKGPVDPRSGEAPTEDLEGTLEVVRYACPAKLSQVQLQRNALNAFKTAGFTVVYSGNNEHHFPAVTVRKGGQWVTVQSGEWNEYSSYTLTALKVEEMAQKLTADASAMAVEIENTGSVAVYGINFDTGKATFQPGAESVLQEVAAMMKAQPEWLFEVQGHTDNVGAAAANLALSEQRARAVVAWLAKNGIDGSRLVAKGYGDSQPVADNASEEGRAKNRRVELKKR